MENTTSPTNFLHSNLHDDALMRASTKINIHLFSSITCSMQALKAAASATEAQQDPACGERCARNAPRRYTVHDVVPCAVFLNTALDAGKNGRDICKIFTPSTHTASCRQITFLNCIAPEFWVDQEPQDTHGGNRLASQARVP